MAIYRGVGGANEATDLATNQAVVAKEYAEQAANSATAAGLTLDTFQDIYLGAFSTSPTLDNDGNALQIGALYFNSSDKLLRVYDGTNWLISAVSEPSSFARNWFSGNGSTVSFTLSSTPVNADSVFVFISGVLTTNYIVIGNTLTFGTAPASGTNNVLAVVASTVSTLAPADDSVSTAKLQTNAVTTAKLADAAVTSTQLANNAVTSAKLDTNIAVTGTLSSVGYSGTTGTYTGSLNVGGNLNLTNGNNRITGDFSNTSVLNRVLIQTSTANGNTAVSAVPNGTGTSSGFSAFANSTGVNTNFSGIFATPTSTDITAGVLGTGTYVPMLFYVGGEARMQIDTYGRVGIKVAPDQYSSLILGRMDTSSEGGQLGFTRASDNAVAWSFDVVGASSTPMFRVVDAVQTAVRLTIDSVGNIVSRSPTGAIGYGNGAYSGVVQTGNKSTAVTNNTPAGYVVTNNASLAAGAAASFTVNCSAMQANDVVIPNIASITSNYSVRVSGTATGSFVLTIKNESTDTLAEAVTISYAIIRCNQA